MTRKTGLLIRPWLHVGTRFLPFADAASADLPLSRLLRLSLFQVSVGMALALLNGTLNRVMIVEMGASAWLVALMVSLPLVFAPFRALIGFRSDHHRSALGWKRVPYMWIGTLLQFGGLAIMPFALIVLSGDTHGPVWIGQAGAAAAFLLVGAGMHTTQTAGIALATDLAPAGTRPRVVALLYVMLLLGMVAAALLFGLLLGEFSQRRLIAVIQGAALATVVLNVVALWKQEARDPTRARSTAAPVAFRAAWRELAADRGTFRLLVAVALGTAAFSMQDILLEPYGGEIMHLGVGSTTLLTALFAAGALAAFGLSARGLTRGGDPLRLAAAGALAGIVAFEAVVFAAPFSSPTLLRSGAVLIGLGGGLFSVGTLTSAMSLADRYTGGLALGAWGAVQATAAGSAIGVSGALRDSVSSLATHGALGSALTDPAVGYSFVYHLEIVLLFATLIALGPLVRAHGREAAAGRERFGLAELPG
jgi:MFS transporter, BCD family, chlorophyll transporter